MIDRSSRDVVIVPNKASSFGEELVPEFNIDIVTELQMTKDAEIANAPVDSKMGVQSLDFHMDVSRPEFQLTVTVTDTETAQKNEIVNKMIRLMNERILFRMTCEMGVYDNCVCTNVTVDATPDAINSWVADFTIKQVLFVSTQLTYYHVIFDTNGDPVGTSTTVTGGLTITLSNPIDEPAGAVDYDRTLTLNEPAILM